MSKKFIVAITIFVILVGFLFLVNLNLQKDSKPQVTPQKKSNPHSIYTASLSLMPNPIFVTASNSASLNVILSGNLPEQKIILLQIELAYYPSSLLNVSVIPGDYFIDPQVTLSNIDFRTGRISYAIKGERSQTSKNIIAQINFSVSNYGILRQTEMRFLPKTLVHVDGEMVNLNETKDANIIIKPAFFQYIPPASPSGTLRP